jgi:dolichol-phosphate mannosyltransferase
MCPVSLASVEAAADAADVVDAAGPLLPIDVSLVIPTFNERAGVAPLVAALRTALEGLRWEAVFVDDSTDGTEGVLSGLAADDRRVRVLHRAQNLGGLAGAVVDGLALARGEHICVLDADLQHPPERIPELLEAARQSGADVVIASRYVAGGSTGGLAGPMRQLYSRGLKTLARTMFPLRLAGITDPLGGYFVVRRAVLEGVALRPVGYKILLEILVRCPWGRMREVPYRFEPRRFGASKATFRQGMEFLRHLGLLVWDCSPALAVPRALVGQRPAAPPAVPERAAREAPAAVPAAGGALLWNPPAAVRSR